MSKKDYIPKQMKAYVYKRDGRKCRYCGDTNGPFHLDHVYPESKGGITKAINLVVSCADCNRKKHARIGLWPYPIGYFDIKNPMPNLHLLIVLMIISTLVFATVRFFNMPILSVLSAMFSIGFTFSVVTHS